MGQAFYIFITQFLYNETNSLVKKEKKGKPFHAVKAIFVFELLSEDFYGL